MFEKYRKVNVYIGKTKLSISVRIIVQNFEATFGAFLLLSPMTDFCSQSLKYFIIYLKLMFGYLLDTGLPEAVLESGASVDDMV